ncbi:NAD(P)-dependent alcohol dehydrogenase [Patescibacteria group bacterium]
MKAIVYEKYGPPEVLQLKEVEKPGLKENEVLVKVHAATVTKYDCWMRSCTAPPGFNLLMRIASGIKPKKSILGTELAGEIEAVGGKVTRFKKGDQVFGYLGMNLGAYAQYVCLPEIAVADKPANVSYEEAASVLQGALTALFFLRKADIQPGQKVLIFGASGGVGSFAVQLAKHHFKTEVTGICSTAKMAFVRSLGGDTVIDYTKEDFTRNGQIYDVVFDTVGKTSVSRTKRSLKENGSYLLTTFGLFKLLQLLWLSKTSSLNLNFGTLTETTEDLIFVKDLVEAGTIKPTIDKCFPFKMAAEAHHYVESGRKKGSVVIKMLA